MNFKEIYEKSLIDAETKHIQSSNFSSKPIMVTGIISPESIISIQPVWGVDFSLDNDGMNEVIEMLENTWKEKTENDKNNLLIILTDIYSITEKYLGGHGITETRINEYLQANNTHLCLSEIKKKNIGQCAERAAIGHQLLSILEKANLINFESILTNSHMTVDTMTPHSFIVLKHKNDSTKQYLFDIENPLEFKMENNSKVNLGIALYPMTEEEYQSFKEGESISPQSIFEQAGMSMISNKRYYGDKEPIYEDKKNSQGITIK